MKAKSIYFLPALASTVVAQYYAGCDVSQAIIDIPQNQSLLEVPAGLVPNSIALGVGIQNYTCTDSGNYTYV